MEYEHVTHQGSILIGRNKKNNSCIEWQILGQLVCLCNTIIDRKEMKILYVNITCHHFNPYIGIRLEKFRKGGQNN